VSRVRACAVSHHRPVRPGRRCRCRPRHRRVGYGRHRRRWCGTASRPRRAAPPRRRRVPPGPGPRSPWTGSSSTASAGLSGARTGRRATCRCAATAARLPRTCPSPCRSGPGRSSPGSRATPAGHAPLLVLRSRRGPVRQLAWPGVRVRMGAAVSIVRVDPELFVGPRRPGAGRPGHGRRDPGPLAIGVSPGTELTAEPSGAELTVEVRCRWPTPGRHRGAGGGDLRGSVGGPGPTRRPVAEPG
jgi:hypothetical protein